MLMVYGYMKCSTCRKAIKWLDEAGCTYEFIDITTDPPSEAVLKKLLKKGDYGLKQLFNTSGVLYREMKMKEKVGGMNEGEAVKLLSSEGKLVKRPIVTDGKDFSVGFKEDVFKAKWV
ncbi:Regulatory protein Spx [Poriferisphaera corsica]|uniref:Regulatory protein Spx n=2 Tax=Poriferisphaera corsica TaxID=2528020 RepID=A0A517YWS9_9BACT|nr:Regulatory protein Spx [Poriferisphaera corsica]